MTPYNDDPIVAVFVGPDDAAMLDGKLTGLPQGQRVGQLPIRSAR